MWVPFSIFCSLLPTLGGIYIVMLTVHKTVVLLVNLILVADSAQRFGSHVAWDFNGCSFCNALIMNYWRWYCCRTYHPFRVKNSLQLRITTFLRDDVMTAFCCCACAWTQYMQLTGFGSYIPYTCIVAERIIILIQVKTFHRLWFNGYVWILKAVFC